MIGDEKKKKKIGFQSERTKERLQAEQYHRLLLYFEKENIYYSKPFIDHRSASNCSLIVEMRRKNVRQHAYY